MSNFILFLDFLMIVIALDCLRIFLLDRMGITKDEE